MKRKSSFVLLTLCLIASLALAQTDQATGPVTNDETQARLRVNNCIWSGPNIDVYVNGEVAVNGPVPQTDQGFWVGSYLFLTPGTHSIAIVPTGKSINEALVSPLDVPLEEGHRYTLVVMGQADETEHEALLIDETEAYQEIGATPTDTTQITLNNIRGVSGIDFSLGGEVRNENVPNGGYKTAIWPSGNVKDLAITVSGAPDQFIDKAPEVYLPAGVDEFDCFGGTYPGTMGSEFEVHSSPYTSTLSTINFLQVQTDVAAQVDGHTIKFTTFLNALETAGLTELLTTGNPHYILAPTDKAFAALPKDQLDALMADPEALANLLRYHIVEGYYPRGGLTGEGAGHPKVLTNLLGMELELLPNPLTINGVDVGATDSVFVANGSRVEPITAVLMPPEQ